MSSQVRQFFTNLLPRFWNGVIEREKIRDSYQNIEKGLEFRNKAEMNFSDCNPEYLGGILGKKHNRTTNLIKSKGIDEGQGEYKIPNEQWRLKIINQSKNMSRTIMAYNFLTVMGWLVLILILAFILSNLTGSLVSIVDNSIITVFH